MQLKHSSSNHVQCKQADREFKKWTCLRARTGRVADLGLR